VQQYSIPHSEDKFSRALNLYLFGTFFALVLISTGSPIFVRILSTEPFWGATPYVAILAAAYLWDGAGFILAAGNSWERKTYYNTAGSLTGGLVTVVLLWWGIGRFGLPIVAFSFWMGTVVKIMLILWTAQRNHHIPYSQRAIGMTLILSLSYAVMCYALAEFTFLALIPMAMACFLIGCILQAAMWFTMLRPREKSLINSTTREMIEHIPFIRSSAPRVG
jgi:O-antigen/teichoic acid export membrane protein